MACSGGEACLTCDGRCCSLFTFSTPLETMADRVADPDKAQGSDDLQLLQLLVPITDEEAKERAERFGVQGRYKHALDTDRDQPNGYYKCRAWDEETRLCTIYEDRPRMCRAYPYGDACSHGCDFTVNDDHLAAEGWITPAEWFKKGYA